MIHLSAEAICDVCHNVVASTGPQNVPLPKLMDMVTEKARNHGAHIGICTMICDIHEPIKVFHSRDDAIEWTVLNGVEASKKAIFNKTCHPNATT